MNPEAIIPTHPHLVTAAWMTAALRAAGLLRKSRVTSLSVEPVGNQGLIGQVARFRLSYDRVEHNQVASLIAKFPHPNPDYRKGMQSIYQREINFYENLGAAAAISLPRSIYSVMDENSADNILLLEDLSEGSRPGCLVCGCTLEEARAAILRLARFHAAWWENERLAQFHWLPHKQDFIRDYSTDQFCADFEDLLHKLHAELPDVDLSGGFLQPATLLARNYTRVKSFLYKAPTTLVHDDYHLDNLLFRGSESLPETVALDWQCVAKGPGVTDLGYFISFCLSTEQRRQAENDLLQTYHDELCERGVRGYDFSRFLIDFRLSGLEPLERLVQVRFLIGREYPRALAIYEAVLPRMGSFLAGCRIDELLG